MKKISSLILMGLSFSAGAETILNFDENTLENITSIGQNSLFNESITVNTQGGDFTISPRDGVFAAKISAPNESLDNISLLSDFLGVENSAVENHIFPTGSSSLLQPTSFGFGGTTIDLVPNKNYSFYWATANSDYSPFSDGTFFALSNNQNQFL